MILKITLSQHHRECACCGVSGSLATGMHVHYPAASKWFLTVCVDSFGATFAPICAVCTMQFTTAAFIMHQWNICTTCLSRKRIIFLLVFRFVCNVRNNVMFKYFFFNLLISLIFSAKMGISSLYLISAVSYFVEYFIFYASHLLL